jgi:hypothetical protein
MGTRWEGAIIRATDQELDRLPAAFLPYAADMRPRIRVTLAAFGHPAAPDVWLLEVSGINKNPLEVATINDRLPGVGIPTPVLPLWQTRASATLALVASRVIGQSTWVFHSDGLSQSASVRLDAGHVVEAVCGDADAYQDYGRAAVAGLRFYLPKVMEVDDLLDMYYAEPAVSRRWRLMDRRTLLAEPMVLE